MKRWSADILQDLRFGIRILAKRPGFTAAAVATLALGIGATTAVFSIVNGALLRPLPYKDPDRLVGIWDKGIHQSNLTKLFGSYADFDTFRRNAKSFESVAAATWAAGASRVMTGRGPARTVLAIPASAEFFDTLGVRATLGRTFVPEDETHGCSVVLAHSFWTSSLGADPAIVGQSLILDRKPCRVLGVAPPEFAFYPGQTHMWMLLGPDFEPKREQLIVGIFARLKPGVTPARAQVETAALHQALHQADGREPDFEPDVNPLQGEFTFLAGRTLRTTLLVVFGAVALVLLIACLNLSNLLLGRLSERHRELAVRAALGSGQLRLVRQVLTEGLLLSLMGAAAGVAFAVAAVRYFKSANPIELTVGSNVQVNLPVLLFSSVLAVAATLIFALLPALQVSRVDLTNKLKGTGPRVAAKIVIAVEMGVSLVLLMGAALLLSSALRMGSANLGFDPGGIVEVNVRLPMPKYADEKQRNQLYEALLEKVKQLPGADEAAAGSKFPPYVGGNQQIEIQGAAGSAHGSAYDVGADAISPDYFGLLKTRVLQGRAFGALDRLDSEPVAIVNQALADEYFPHSNPIGQQLRLAGGKMLWLRVVGVAGNLKHTALMNEMKWVETPILYRPLAQEARASVVIGVRGARDAALLGRGIQQLIAGADSEVPLSDPEELAASLTKTLEYPRFRAEVLSMFAVGALLLSAVGLYGVLAQIVVQRTKEFGLRRAVGAQTRHLLVLVARQGGVPVLIGLACGLIGSAAASRILSGFLYGVESADPELLALASSMLLLVSALAIVMPAWRAARVDPMKALRSE